MKNETPRQAYLRGFLRGVDEAMIEARKKRGDRTIRLMRLGDRAATKYQASVGHDGNRK